jgi:hypothetical protein
VNITSASKVAFLEEKATFDHGFCKEQNRKCCNDLIAGGDVWFPRSQNQGSVAPMFEAGGVGKAQTAQTRMGFAPLVLVR